MNAMSLRCFIGGGEEGGGLGGDSFASAGESEVFGGCCFDADAVEWDLEVGGYVCAHGGDVWGHFGCLCDDCDVDVCDLESVLG